MRIVVAQTDEIAGRSGMQERDIGERGSTFGLEG
jgi:hypothetical protein